MNGWKPWFRADWIDAVFVHFKVNAARLQAAVPLDLDQFAGQAIVSLVAFTQTRLRPAGMGRLGELLSSPLAHHEFLNLRTYVQNGDERGIYFISEWIPNRLAALIGPATYGLPYRIGKLSYRIDSLASQATGIVQARGGRFEYAARLDSDRPARVADAGSIDEFLLERYQAFTYRDRILRTFRIDHARWEWRSIMPELRQTSLLEEFGSWMKPLEMIGAHYSPGVRNVAIGGAEKTDITPAAVYNTDGGKPSWRV